MPRVNSDAYWNQATCGDTRMITASQARRLDYFGFTFVRDPVARAVSCYANKFLRNDAPLPRPLRDNGFSKDMDFAAFVARLCACPDKQLDVHLRPQATMLCFRGQVVPQFVGRVETLDADWTRLREILGDRDGLDLPPRLEVRNPTGGAPKAAALAALPEHEAKLRARYAEDYRLFYPDR